MSEWGKERAAEKRCSKCETVKPRSEFYELKKPKAIGLRKSYAWDGLSYYCRACHRQVNAKRWGRPDYKKAKAARQRAERLDPSRRERLLERDRKTSRADRVRHPIQWAARAKVKTAIKQGVLVVPAECSGCRLVPKPFTDGRRALHAHHRNGYENALDVVWLCVSCHADEHARERRALKSAKGGA